MKIEKLNNKTVKVVLSLTDLEDFQITYDDMNYSDENTKQAILLIVQQIKCQTGLPVESVRLFIEAFPDDVGGCILYVNLMESKEDQRLFSRDRKSFDTPIGFEFECLEVLSHASSNLLLEFGHLITKSELYQYQEKYRLLLYTYCKMEKKIIHFLQEYGVYLGKGSVLCAIIKEHGTPIATQDAVETIVKYLH